jgi:hypothetical protein
VPLTAQDVQWVEAGIRRDYSVAAQVAGMVLLEGTEDEPIPESSRIWRYVGLVQQRAPASKQPGISSICAHLAGLGVHRYRTVPAAIPVRPDNADQQEWDARFARVWLT